MFWLWQLERIGFTGSASTAAVAIILRLSNVNYVREVQQNYKAVRRE